MMIQNINWSDNPRFNKSREPVGTIHTWADGKRRQKQSNGDWKEIDVLASEDITSIDAVAKVKSSIKAPFVSAYRSTLGGEHRASIMMTVSLDDRSTWVNGILENSRYMKLALHRDGTLEQISGRCKDKNFRKIKVKSIAQAIDKINNYIGLPGETHQNKSDVATIDPNMTIYDGKNSIQDDRVMHDSNGKWSLGVASRVDMKTSGGDINFITDGKEVILIRNTKNSDGFTVPKIASPEWIKANYEKYGKLTDKDFDVIRNAHSEKFSPTNNPSFPQSTVDAVTKLAEALGFKAMLVEINPQNVQQVARILLNDIQKRIWLTHVTTGTKIKNEKAELLYNKTLDVFKKFRLI